MNRNGLYFGLMILLVVCLLVCFFGTENKKYLLNRDPVGGLGDRLRCVVLSYYVAFLSDRQYLINGTSFFSNDYEELMLPAHYDWDGEEIFDSPTYIYSQMNGNDYPIHQQNLGFVKKRRIWEFTTNYIRLDEMLESAELKKHRSYILISELARQGRLWNFALRTLFRPGAKIQQIIDKIYQDFHISNNTFKIGIQLRLGDSPELCSDTVGDPQKRKRGDRFVMETAVSCFAERAERFWTELPPSERATFDQNPIFFVTSDSSSAGSHVKDALKKGGYRVFDAEEYVGKPKHIDKTHGDQTRTFLDWWLMTKMNRLVISQSGFAESAAKFSCAGASVYYRNYEKQESCLDQFYNFFEIGLCNPFSDNWNLYEILPKLV